MIRAELVSHPLTPSQTVRSIVASIAMDETLLTLSFVVVGQVSHIRLPVPCDSSRADELWQHTCFELFARSPGTSSYCEFNFAPSTQWAAYRFAAYREGMAVMDVHSPPHIQLSASDDLLQMNVNIDTRDLPATNTSLALSAVIEDVSGAKSYWALQHRVDKPDFHYEHGFVLTVN
jgi:hypothetical protein